MSRLIRGRDLPENQRETISAELRSQEAKEVAEASLDRTKYSASDVSVQKTADHLIKWLDANQKISELRKSRRRAVRRRERASA